MERPNLEIFLITLILAICLGGISAISYFFDQTLLQATMFQVGLWMLINIALLSLLPGTRDESSLISLICLYILLVSIVLVKFTIVGHLLHLVFSFMASLIG